MPHPFLHALPFENAFLTAERQIVEYVDILIEPRATNHKSRIMTRLLFGCLVFVFPVVAAVAEDAVPVENPSDFFRVVRKEDKRQPYSFDTAVVRFTDAKKKIEVDLIGAVHVGDKEYYEELNERFKVYDSVLYELVAETGTKVDKKAVEEKKKKNVLTGFQSGMGEALDLEFQLAHVDYAAPNFVHADLSPEKFAERVAERGDLLQMLYRVLVLGLSKGTEGADAEMKTQGRILGTLFSSNPPLSLKRFFAKEMLAQMDDSMWVIGGDDGSAIITDRNAAALNVLRKRMARGDKKIAIFYGGAHLPEFAKSLKKDFRMMPTQTTWVIAWDLTSDRSARKNDD